MAKVDMEQFTLWEAEAFKRTAPAGSAELKRIAADKVPEPMKAIAASSAIARHAAAQLIGFKATTKIENFAVNRQQFLSVCARAWDSMAQLSGFDEVTQTTAAERMKATRAALAQQQPGGETIDDVVEDGVAWPGFFTGKGGDA